MRELRAREIRAIRESKNPLLSIAEGCAVKVIDPGPYTLHDGSHVRWSEVLAGEMMTATLAVAEAGFGVKRSVPFECTDEDCRKRCPRPTLVPLDLKADLTIRPIDPAVLAQFLADNRFTCTVAGKTVTYRLPTGATIDAAFRLAPDAHQWQSLADSILEIEGVGKFNPDKIAWIDDLPAGDLKALGEGLAQHDCGPQSTLKVQCRWCGRERDRVIPFANLTLES
jgi:hypothetical protein